MMGEARRRGTYDARAADAKARAEARASMLTGHRTSRVDQGEPERRTQAAPWHQATMIAAVCQIAAMRARGGRR